MKRLFLWAMGLIFMLAAEPRTATATTEAEETGPANAETVDESSSTDETEEAAREQELQRVVEALSLIADAMAETRKPLCEGHWEKQLDEPALAGLARIHVKAISRGNPRPLEKWMPRANDLTYRLAMAGIADPQNAARVRFEAVALGRENYVQHHRDDFLANFARALSVAKSDRINLRRMRLGAITTYQKCQKGVLSGGVKVELRSRQRAAEVWIEDMLRMPDGWRAGIVKLRIVQEAPVLGRRIRKPEGTARLTRKNRANR